MRVAWIARMMRQEAWEGCVDTLQPWLLCEESPARGDHKMSTIGKFMQHLYQHQLYIAGDSTLVAATVPQSCRYNLYSTVLEIFSISNEYFFGTISIYLCG